METRHPAAVRITHWVHALSFLALAVSGTAILLAHPRLYWGETGAVGGPSLVDLPLPFVLVGQSGWGRSLHFLSAWILVVNGIAYVASGVVRHRSLRTYQALRRRTYALVVFVLAPLMIWTGLAMSPAVTSVFPAVVTILGGQQSARTIHFLAGNALVVFLAGHVLMVMLSGFTAQFRAMTIGGVAAPGEPT